MGHPRSILLSILAFAILPVACSNAIANEPSPVSLSIAATSPQGQLNTALIERLTGHKGTFSEKEGAFKVSVPRSDLKVNTAGVSMTPPMGLTSWAAFQPAGSQAMVMGDMVMTEDQVNPVMSVALANGLEVTGLHNHFFWDSPKIMFMHIGGMADQSNLASAVGKVFAAINSTSGGKGRIPYAKLAPTTTTLDPKKIEAIIGAPGDLSNGVYKVTIGRTSSMHGYKIGNTMGVNTWAAFVGSDQQAVVNGDFAMYEDELQNVLKALRDADINIVAIHNHMVGESPKVMFLHFWGVGTPQDLAKGIKSALDKTRG